MANGGKFKINISDRKYKIVRRFNCGSLGLDYLVECAVFS